MALIYIVEDDEPIRRELADILARAGFEVEACESFEHVSRDILAAAPDLVLLDLTLPVKDGQHICHANPRSPSSSLRRARPKSTRSWP
jgi:DNA-binding response OmpR family regulator